MHTMIKSMQNMHISLSFNTFSHILNILKQFYNIYESVYIELFKFVYIHVFYVYNMHKLCIKV